MKNSYSRFSFRRSISFVPSVFLLAVFITFGGTALHADTYTVTTVSDDVSDTGSLRYAIENALSGDVISFDLEYPATITLESQIGIYKGIAIQGPGADQLIISGSETCRIFYIRAPGSVHISGIAIVDGNSEDEDGGGIYNYSSNLTLINCALTENNAVSGGGIYNYYSDSTLSDCSFSSNSAIDGGGIYNDNCSLRVTNCTFSSNIAGDGGGIYNNYSDSTVEGCSFSSNEAGRFGGGICNKNSNPQVTNCTFSESYSSFGGGINNDSSSPIVTNCTFIKNYSDKGAGICNYFNSPAMVMNCTFKENKAGDGSGICNFLSSSPIVTNCIFWDDGDYEILNCIEYNGSSFSYPQVGYCVIKNRKISSNSYVTGDILTADPLLGPLADNGGPTLTCSLSKGSSAIDAGTETGAPSTDQRGVPRPQGGSPDIGAYEFGGNSYVINLPRSDEESGDGGCNISALSGIALSLVLPLMFLSVKMK